MIIYTPGYDSDKDCFFIADEHGTTTLELAGPHQATDKKICEALALVLNSERVAEANLVIKGKHSA